MKHMYKNIKKVMLAATCMLAALSWNANALELSDLHIPMTRSEADDTLSKDYNFTLLADGSIRRTWQLEGKKVIIDFSSATDEAILIAVVYDKPVAKKEGIKDAHTIAEGQYKKDATWDAPKNKEARESLIENYGLTNAMRKKLEGKAMLFYETNDKKTKITRVSAFTYMPRSNRWILPELKEGDDSTAMSTQWSPDQVRSMFEDEERRKATPTVSDRAAAAANSTPSVSVGARRVVKKTAMGTTVSYTDADKSSDADASAPTETSVTPAGEEKVVVKLDKGRRASSNLSFLAEPPMWLKSVGIEEPTWWHYIGIGIIALLLLIFIIRSVSQSSRASKQRQNFAKVIAKAPTKGNLKIRR